MKKRMLPLLSLSLLALASCNNLNNSSTNSKTNNNINITSTTEIILESVEDYKNAAYKQLDERINPIMAVIKDEDLKTLFQTFYTNEILYIDGITDINKAKKLSAKIDDDMNIFLVTRVKPLIITKLNSFVNPIITAISNNEIKSSLQSFYKEEMTKLENLTDLEEFINVYNEIYEDTTDYINNVVLSSLKDEYLEEMDLYVSQIIDDIIDPELKTEIQSLYNTEKEKIENAETIEDLNLALNGIKDDIEDYTLDELKEKAISEIEAIKNSEINKITDYTLKTAIEKFVDDQIDKIEAIDSFEEISTTVDEIIEDTKEFIASLITNN